MRRPKRKAPLLAPKQTTKRVTRSVTKAAPCQAVLNTVELLELILLQLPAQDLFVLQRVCQRWQQVMVESAAILKKLFFLPGDAPKQRWVVNTPLFPRDRMSQCSTNCYLDDYHFHILPKGQCPDHGVQVVTPARLNPLLYLSPIYSDPVTSADRVDWQRGERVKFTLALPFRSVDASWRNM